MIEVNHSKIKETNRKKIIKLLLEKNEVTKLDISRSLDISITTVSTNITELKKEGIVSDVRSLESTGGRKAMALKINENCRFALGIALTPRHVKLSLINLKKEVIGDIRIRHNKKDIESIIAIAKENINKILNNKEISIDKLLGIGISIPGTVDSEEGIIKNCYLLGAENYNLKKSFEEFNTTIYIDNEANLSAYYEFLNKKDILSNLLYVSITDGLGLGIIIDGKIYRGSNNAAGEMGHIKIIIGGKSCKCGSQGCLESYTSKNVLIEDFNEISNEKLNDIEEFISLFEKGDKTTKEVLERYFNILGIGIANLTMLLDPSSVVLGGDINSLLKENIDVLRSIVYKDNLFTNEENCKIDVTEFKESYLLGAAMVPLEEFLN
ncbi:MAG: ROK family transcriptional regulator [Clostridium sp.]|uniref:ROK family transcriptional regulator n=1 Tax=Clostridium saudiense TaxID=1414720 RepID=A0ABS2FCR0_9CLOT|nr:MULTISPECIES: ROK family transcriptional regulator [Clostridiaceae]MBM6818064.1 ROK family transcriptional regulator [Clostridium saudiense]MBQ8998351.1 ROK family transcriptional regulator [Clostridium sp.]